MKAEMRKCELCSDTASTYCESDTASLCLSCDAKVHGANFLVAKHERCLLCSVCQMATEWKASGPRLGRKPTICDGCVNSRSGVGKVAGTVEEDVGVEEAVVESEGDYGGGDVESESSGDEEDEDDEEVEEDDDDDDDEENQVVPWSSGEEVSSSSGNGGGGGESDWRSKRRRLSSDLETDDEDLQNSTQMMRRRPEDLRFISRNSMMSRLRSTVDIRSGNQNSWIFPGLAR